MSDQPTLDGAELHKNDGGDGSDGGGDGVVFGLSRNQLIILGIIAGGAAVLYARSQAEGGGGDPEPNTPEEQAEEQVENVEEQEEIILEDDPSDPFAQDSQAVDILERNTAS